MSEPIPQWCPYCHAAAKEVHPEGTRYTCGSQASIADGIGMNIQRDLCRVRELEQLRDRVKRLVEVGDTMAAWNRNPRNLGGDPFMADQWDEAKGQP